MNRSLSFAPGRTAELAHAAPCAVSPPAPGAATDRVETVAPFPTDAVQDDGMWFDDDALAYGLGDDVLFDAIVLDDLDEAGVSDDPATFEADDAAPGAPGERRIERRIVIPGGEGEGPAVRARSVARASCASARACRARRAWAAVA
jgi:hypothetical protein